MAEPNVAWASYAQGIVFGPVGFIDLRYNDNVVESAKSLYWEWSDCVGSKRINKHNYPGLPDHWNLVLLASYV